MRISRILIWTALSGAGSRFAREIELQVELMNQVSTTSSHKDDMVTAKVLSPVILRDDMLEGKVVEVKSGAKLGGQSVLSLNFDTLRHGDSVVPVSTQMKSEVRCGLRETGVLDADVLLEVGVGCDDQRRHWRNHVWKINLVRIEHPLSVDVEPQPPILQPALS